MKTGLKANCNIHVKKIWFDNAGENHAMKALCESDGNVISFECTVPGTPQKCGHAEQKFATLSGWVSVMPNGGNFLLTEMNLEGWDCKYCNSAQKLCCQNCNKTGAFNLFGGSKNKNLYNHNC